MRDPQAIIERFRQAAFGACDWNEALATAATAMSAKMVHLVALGEDGAPAFNHILGATDDMIAEYLAIGGLNPAINPRTHVALTYATNRCFVDDDVVDAQQRARSPMYRLFRRSDADHSAMVPIACAGARGSFTAMRSRAPYDEDERRLAATIVPAVADICAQAVVLGSAIDGAMLTTVEALAATVILLGEERRVARMSCDAEALLMDGGYLKVRRGRIVAADPAEDVALSRAFVQATDPRRQRRTVGRIILRGTGGDLPMVVECGPLPDRPSGPFSQARAMLSVRSAPHARTAALLGELYPLTAGEAAVAALLASGADLKTIATARGCSVETVRTQVKALFDKTGARRQGELIALLHRTR